MGAYDTWTQDCPYCKTVCDADFVDNGIGMQQCGPFHCDNCGASQIGPFDKERTLSAQEQDKGWYAPHSEPGSSANVIGGRVVSHRQMQATYKREFTDNPLWHDKAYVDNWWDEIRKA